MIVTIRTDKPEAEIGLYEGHERIAYELWEAHRALAETLHSKIEALLTAAHKDWKDIKGIVVFEGPGSFTGLRIGIATANAMAYGLQVPIVATQSENWIELGINRLLAVEQEEVDLQLYVLDAHITVPKK